jgi:glycosyltransferase involved in cell wall biosynthesis
VELRRIERFWQMRIGMEVSPLIWERTGIQNYILGLLGGFAARAEDHEFVLYTNRPLPFEPELPPRFRVSVVDRPSPRFQLWFQTALPMLMRKDRLDVFHGTFYRLPMVMPVPGVLTVHDLSGLLLPELHTRKTHMVNRMYPVFVRKAAAVIAVSAATAAELEKRFPGTARKTVVIHEAADPRLTPVTDPGELQRVRRKYSLPERFILFLGTLEPRKNLAGLLDAFTIASSRIPHHLVVAGALGWKTAAMEEKFAATSLRDRILMTGRVPDEDVPGLLSLCEIFVYPSLYEGFGLPVLEAMACGAPVVTSCVSSMPEVAGDAALLVDPLSPGDMASAIQSLAGDGELRRELSLKGRARAAGFSWTRAAGETMDVYRSVAGRGSA